MTSLFALSTLRAALPFLVTMLCGILAGLPVRLPLPVPLSPDLPLMAVFYWTIYRPDLMPPSVILAAGLLLDLLAGGPVGITSLAFLLVSGVLMTQRRVFLSKPFAVTWWGFALIATLVAAIRWAMAALIAGRSVPLAEPTGQLLATVALFPLVAWVLVVTQRRLLDRGVETGIGGGIA